jgi:arylsulfatase A
VRSPVGFGSAAVLLLAGLAAPAAQSPGSDKPNVVLIMTDDMGYADIGTYGATDIRTPNIDSLARDGVKLTDFYANAMSCTPTRAGLISGRYQQRYGLEFALADAGTRDGNRGLPALNHSLPLLLKKNGYATALIGKWHLGYKPEYSPRVHGFDYFYGQKSGVVDYYTHAHPVTGQPDLWENETLVHHNGYLTDLITRKAVDFVANTERPFFLDVAYNSPHSPFQVPDKPSAPPAPGTATRADYAAMIERVDRGVGEILQTLNKHGLTNNTIVIFTNDNGGVFLSNNRPLSGRKFSAWEGGIRVPAVIRWPGRIPHGKVSEQVGITMDFTASILAASHAVVPENARLEGINLFPILEGKAPLVSRTLFWRTAGVNLYQKAVRSGDWKLLVNGAQTLLFNVRTDPGERQDLSSRQNDVVKRLRGLIAEWERDVDAERTRGPTGDPVE